MRCQRLFLFGFVFAFVAIHRLPAPVEELPDNPTPAAIKRAEPKEPKNKLKPAEQNPKSKTAPRPNSSAAPRQPPLFGSTWKGIINQGVAGTIPVTLTINPAGTSVLENSQGTTFTHIAMMSGNLLTWKTGWLNEIIWTLTPNGDGKSASVTSTSAFGVNGSAIFQRQ